MQRVVNFYQKLPRGAAPEVKATGFLGRYQAKHFGKNPSGKRMWLNPYPDELRARSQALICSQPLSTPSSSS